METYKQYLEELHDGKSVYYNEKGFASYWIRDFNMGKECYIEDIYIKPEFRRSNASIEFADEIEKIAKIQNCTHLTGSVVPSANNSTVSLKMMLSAKFKLHSSVDNIIWFIKDIT